MTLGAVLFVLAVLAGLGVAALLYFLPTVVAGLRGARHGVAILAVNVLFGWTFVGWAIALVWALADEKAS